MIGGLLQRVWPASLYRQILLVAALALFVAQAINMAILLNGARNRSAGEAATLLISRVASQADRQAGRDADWEGRERDRNERLREGRGGGGRNGRRNGPRIGPRIGKGAIVIAQDDRRFTPPDFDLEPDFTMRADEILAQSGSDLRDLQIFSGPAKLLPGRFTDGLMQSRFVDRLRQRGERIPHEAILLTAQTGQGQWISAAALVRPAARASIAAMLLQTLTLYIAVLFPLAIVARRIVKPLERLTQRVGMVGLETGLGAGLGGDLEPLESEGPSDIRKLVESFNAMQARVSGLLGEKDVMLGAIGHDLKTPLAALRVRIESVEDDDDREKMAATIDEMVIILDDILTLARLGKSGEAMQRTDIGALIDSVVDEFVTAGGAAEFLENDPLLEKDHRILANIRPVLMRRALRNLIANALKHGGNAAVSVAQARGYIRIKIADNGPGIPPDKMEEIFAPFARLENSRNRATGGSGLGLTIARAIARAHGGDIRLENGAAGGLTAWIELPAECAIA